MFRLIALLLLPLLPGAAVAQTLYNVRVGTFQDVRSDDFTELRDLGFVYGEAREGQLTDVFIGHYTTQAKADEVTGTLKERGFRNAVPLRMAVADEPERSYIQIALRGRKRELDWGALEQAGKLYVDAADGVTKVVTGPYADAAAANAALPDVRKLGYTDAFVRPAKPAALIPVGTFESGIKKPLIPFTLRDTPAPPREAETTPAPAPETESTPAPADTVAEAEPEPLGEEAVAVADARGTEPPAAPTPDLPEIDAGTKRHSAAELQRLLKAKGYYTGPIDGYYGPGTTAAYRDAWEEMAELRKYTLLADARPPARAGSPLGWPEVRVATTIADDLAAGRGDMERDRALIAGRPALLAASQNLPPAAAAEARDWESTTWEALTAWSATDPLHARLVDALGVAYYQAQVRLEAMYQARGLGATAARDLATAALANLLGADLSRFN